jgi:hypothetical protein
MGPDSHTNALHRVRASFDIWHASLALTAAWLAACSSTLPGARSSPEVLQQPIPQSPVTRVLPEGAPSVATVPPSAPVPSAGAVGSGPVQSPAGASPPPPSPASPLHPPAANAPPPAAAPSDDARDRQFEILNAAVSALRQEVSRSYERVEELGAENQRLRGLVASLRRDLRKSRGANQSLEDHLRTLEKRLSEISSPPEEDTTPTEKRGATPPEERTAPTPPPPPPPQVHPPQAQPDKSGDSENDEGSAAPEDDAD